MFCKEEMSLLIDKRYSKSEVFLSFKKTFRMRKNLQRIFLARFGFVLLKFLYLLLSWRAALLAKKS